MILVLFILNILMCFYIFSKMDKGDTLLERIALTVAGFFGVYGVISGICFFFDIFTFENVLILQLIALLSFVLFNSRKQKRLRKPQGTVDKALLIILGIALLFTCRKFQVYNLGQDQGVYQIEAIQLISGECSVRHDFKEYKILRDDEDKEAYKHMIHKTLTGFYTEAEGDYPTINPEKVTSDVSGVFHGTHTYSAMLGLWGKLFGIEYMMHLSTLLYLCAIILVYYSIGHICRKQSTQIILSTLLAISPLVLWISKSSLSEMPLTLFMAMYMYIFTHPTMKKAWLGLPLVGFAFLHVSYLHVLPGFIVVHLYMYIKQKDNGYLISNIESAVGLAAGYTMMAYTAPQYFYDNLARIYIGDLLCEDNFMIWMYVIAVALIAMSVFFLVDKNEKICSVFEKSLDKWLGPAIKIFVCLCLVIFLYYWFDMGFVKESEEKMKLYYGSGLAAGGHLTIWAFMMATGYLIIPILTYYLLRHFNVFADTKVKGILLLFVYTVFFTSVFVRKEIQYYYYYSRYLVFYIPFILCLGAIVIEQMKPKLTYMIGVVSILLCIPFSTALVYNDDDTNMTWEIFFDLQEAIKPSSAVIVDGNYLTRVAALNIRATEECGIFPVFPDFMGQVELLSRHYDNVYYLADNTRAIYKLTDVVPVNEVVYRDRYLSEKIKVDSSKETYALEKNFTETPKEIVLYRFIY